MSVLVFSSNCSNKYEAVINNSSKMSLLSIFNKLFIPFSKLLNVKHLNLLLKNGKYPLLTIFPEPIPVDER